MAARDRSPFSDYGDSFGIVKPPIVKLEPHLSSQSQSGDADQQNAKEKEWVSVSVITARVYKLMPLHPQCSENSGSVRDREVVESHQGQEGLLYAQAGHVFIRE